MSAIKWLSNVGKSMAYSTVDVIKDMNPTITSFAETNKEVGQVAYKSIKEWKTTLRTTSKKIKENEYVEMGGNIFKNAWADLKSGKFYNRERMAQADAEAMRKFFGDDGDPFGDFDSSFDDDDSSFNSDDSGLDDSDMFLADSMDEVGEKTSTAISSAILKSAEAQTEARVKIYAKEKVSDKLMYTGVRTDLQAINANLANMVKFDSEIMQVHAKNSTDFYTNATGLLTESRDLLKELVESQKTAVKESKGYSSKLDDIFDSEGNINIKGFLSYAKNKTLGGGTFDMIKMYKDMGLFDSAFASPLQFLTKSGIEALIAPKLKKSMENLNKSIGGAFSSLMINSKDWQGDGNVFKNFIGNIFGLDEYVKTGINVSGYEKGKVAWTGIDHKALTEVIPTLLSSINATLGGQDKRFDYAKGKFVSIDDVRKEYNDIFKNSSLFAASDLYLEHLNPAIEKMNFKTKKDEEQFRDAVNKILETNFRNTTTFNPNKKHSASEFGINVGSEEENEALMRRIEEMWGKSVSKSEQLKYSRDLIDALQFHNSRMNTIEREGGIYTQLFNDSDLKGTPIVTASANAAAGANAQNSKKGSKRYSKRSKKNKAAETISQSISSSSTTDNINAAVLERIKAEHPEYFDDKGKLKEQFEIKNGKVERKKVKLSTGIEVLDDTLEATRELVKSKKEKFQDMLNDSQSDITRYINKISESIYNVFFPKEDEDLDEQGMTFAQKISHSISKYMTEEREYYTDRIQHFKDIWYDAKDFISRYFGSGVDGLKEGFKDLWSWIKGNTKDATDWAGITRTDEEKEEHSATSQILQDVQARATEEPKKRNKKKKSKKKNNKENQSSENDESITDTIEGSHAAGDIVEKTGLAFVSKGERIVPDDDSPKATNKRIREELKAAKKTLKDKGAAEEKVYGSTFDILVKNRNWEVLDFIINNNKPFAKWLYSDKDRLKVLAQVNDETASFGGKILQEGKHAAIAVKDRAIQGVNDAKGYFGSKKDEDIFNVKVDSVMGEIKKNYPHFITGAALGGGVSLLTGAIGGPLLGAAAGASIGLLTSSEKLQNMLFGEQDENGERKGGLLPKDISNIITKYAPSMAGGATLGAITSILPFVPGGPVSGIIIGSSLGFLTQSEKAQDALFGLIGGDKEKFQEKVKTALPKMGLGAIAGVAGGAILGGPFGIATNAIIGASLGFASDSEKFKEAVFGVKDEDGNYSGGIIGDIKDAVVQPIKDLMDPLKTQIKVMIKDITRTIKGVFTDVGDFIKNRLKGTRVGNLLGKVAGFGKNALLSPFKLIGGAARVTGDALRKHQIKKGTAVYWDNNQTALERIAERDRLGITNKTQAMINDEALSRLSLEDKQQLLNTATGAFDVDKHVKAIASQQNRNITKMLNDKSGYINIDKGIRKRIRDYVNKGRVDEALAYVNSLDGLDDDKREALAIEVEKAAKAVGAAKSLGADNAEQKQKLQELLKANGFKYDFNKLSKNKKQQELFLKGLENEINDGNKVDEKETPEDRIEDNTSKMVEELKKLNENFEKWLTPDHTQIQDGVLESRIPETTGEVSDKVKRKARKMSIKNNVRNKAVDYQDEDNFDTLVQQYVDMGYSESKAEKKAEQTLNEQVNGSRFKRARTTVKAAIKGTFNWKRNTKDRYKELLAENADREYGFDEDGNYNQRMGFIRSKLNHTALRLKAATQTVKYSYTSSGFPIKIKRGKNNEEQVDMSDTRTAKAVQAEEQKNEEQKSTFTSMKNAMTGLFGRFKRKDDEEEKEKKKKKGGILSTLWEFVLGSKAATFAKIAAIGSVGLAGIGLLDRLGLVDKLGDFMTKHVAPWFKDKAVPALSNLISGAISLIPRGMEVVFSKMLPAAISMFITNLPTILKGVLTGVVDGISGLGDRLVSAFRKEKDPNKASKIVDNNTSNSTSSSISNAFNSVASNVNETKNGVTLSYNVDNNINNAAKTIETSAFGGSPNTVSSTDTTSITENTDKSKSTVKNSHGGSGKSISDLPSAFDNANDAVRKKAESQYDQLKNNTVNVNGKQMTVEELLNSDEYVSSVQRPDGSIVPVTGKEILKYADVASQYGFDTTLSEKDMQAQENKTIITGEERKKAKTVGLVAKSILRPKAAKNASKVLGSTGKVLSKAGKAISKIPIPLPGKKLTSAALKATGKVSSAGAKGIEKASNLPDLLKKIGGASTNVAENIAEHTDISDAEYLVQQLGQSAAKSADDVVEAATKKGIAGKLANGAKKVASKAGDAAKGKLKSLAAKASTSQNKSVIGKFVAAIPEKLSGLMKDGKVAKFFKRAAKTTGTILDEKTYNAMIKALGEKIAKKLEETALKNVGKAVAKITASISTAGVFTVASAVLGFINGVRNANSILGLTEQPSLPIRVACGLTQAVNEALLMGLVPLDLLFELIYSIIKKPLGFEDSNFEKARQDAIKEVQQYNEEHGTNYTVEEYNKKDRLGSKAKRTIGNIIGKKSEEEDKKLDDELDSEIADAGSGTYLDTVDSVTGIKKDKSTKKKTSPLAKFSSKFKKKKNKKPSKTISNLAAAGSGSGLSTFISQNDPRYANTQFNVKGDTQRQTIGDTGCAPASAAMAVNLAACRGLSMSQAASDAINYKKTNDGVTPDYFADEFSRNGLGTQYINDDGNKASKIKSLVGNNHPVVLMGKDSTNKSKKKSPFGSNSHYVVATGMSNDGNTVYINDPEARKANIPYSANKVLGSTNLGIAALGGRGSGFGKNLRKALKGISGRGSYGPDTIQYKVWTRLIGAGFSEYSTAGVMGSIEAESGFNPSVIEKGNGGAGFGLCQWSYGRRDQLTKFAAARNASPSDINLQIDFLIAELTKGINDPNVDYQLMRNGKTDDGKTYTPDMWINATDINTAARAFCWTFERPSVKYAHTDNRVAAAQKYYQEFTGTPGVLGDNSYASAESYTSGDSTTVYTSSSTSSDGESGNILTRLLSAVGNMTSALFGESTSTSSTTDSDGTSYNSDGSTTSTDISGLDTSSVTGNVNSNPAIAAKQRALVAAMKSVEGKLKYSQTGPRDPDQGSADCSSTVRWAYEKVLGVNPGNNTNEQHTDSDTYTVANSLDESKLQLGDLLLKNGHVEMYAGDGQMIGHGGGKDGTVDGPTTKKLSTSPEYNTVRRWVGFKDNGGNQPTSMATTVAASGSGLDMPTLEHSSPLANETTTSVNTTPTVTPVQQSVAPTTNNSTDLLKSLVQSVVQIANNTSLLNQVITLLVKLLDLSSSSGNSNAIASNTSEIANTKAALVNVLSNQSKQDNTVNLQSLISQVETLTAQ